jgi:hypothetical protein
LAPISNSSISTTLGGAVAAESEVTNGA